MDDLECHDGDLLDVQIPKSVGWKGVDGDKLLLDGVVIESGVAGCWCEEVVWLFWVADGYFWELAVLLPVGR